MLADRDSLGIDSSRFSRIQRASLDFRDAAFQVTSDRLGNALVWASLHLSLATTFVANSDEPNLAFLAKTCHRGVEPPKNRGSDHRGRTQKIPSLDPVIIAS